MCDKNLALTPLKCSSHIQINDNEEHSEGTCDEHISKQLQDEEEVAAAIRSVAVIKRSQVEFPVSFRELQSNTDLKTPPSNWLRGQFSICFPNLTPKHSDFTSFIMGYQFPDCIGEVDVVSDAENIKKLLKMAYHPNTHLSMMVHRVGKTILIDEFDIYKYLLRRSQCEWKWLRKFFYEHVLESLARKEENVLVRPNKSRDVVQSKNLLSKFLYHSIGEEKVEAAAQTVTRESPVTVRTISSPTKDSSLGLPMEEHLLDSSVQSFTRNIIWNFEDLRMLIGTDLPIFGGRTHPCVSLRLRDMDKPISILTGIDYWLDSLMCNVPEVVMCYHQDGIVQKYELIKTEDLPDMPDSRFSPQLVRDIAHNILSFLKSKATKEGHTYWLFKGKDDDIVKLYDLTSLCHEDGSVKSFSGCSESKDSDESADNPFTIPVAMLFYCVAKNMWNSKEATDKIPTVKSLLENALRLLRKDKYPKIFCHSHLILADLYLPQDVDPDHPRLFDLEEGEIDLTKSERSCGAHISPEAKRDGRKKKNTKKECECNSINLATLCCHHGFKGSKHKSSDPPKLSKNVYERCDSAIDHVLAALNFLVSGSPEANAASTSSNLNGGVGEEPPTSAQTIPSEPRMARPYEPIPMHYEPLHKLQSTEKQVAASFSSSTVPEEEKEQLSIPKSSSNFQRGAKRRGSSSSFDRGARKQMENFDQKGKDEWFPPPSGSRRQNVIVSKTAVTGAVLNSHLQDASWKDKMKFQMLRKASLVYMTKGRIELNESNYGLCLRYVNLSLRTWCCMLSILGLEQEFPLPSQPLLLAGDAYYNLSKCWELARSHMKDFYTLTKEQERIIEILNNWVCFDDRRQVKIPIDKAQSMTFSYQAFEAAMHTTNGDSDFELKRRLAGICNELGCFYMNQADQICHDLSGGMECAGDLWDQCLKYLEQAISIFEEVGDNENLALLHCNKGRYLRLYAYYSSPKAVKILTPLIEETYEKAFAHYEKAMDIMKSSKHIVHKHVSETVFWEYSSALFSYGTIIQDNPCNEDEDPESWIKSIIVVYNKCLKFCDTKTPGSKESLYQYRSGVIHIRLAAIYHEKFRRNRDSKMVYLAEMHYQKSAVHFLHLDSSPTDIFKVHLDYVVLLEDFIEGMKSHASKWKPYLSILKLLITSVNAIVLIRRLKEEKQKEVEESTKGSKKKGKGKQVKKKGENEVTSEDEILNSFMELYEKKLHSSLLAMLKITKINHKSFSRYGAEVREMYCLSLNKTNKLKDSHLLEAVKAITPIAQILFTNFKL